MQMLSTLVPFSVPFFVPRQVDGKYIPLRKGLTKK